MTLTLMASSLDFASPKISPALAARLMGLAASEVVRLLLMLDVPGVPSTGRRLTPAERAQALANTRATTARLLQELRTTLDAVGARPADSGGLAPLGAVAVDVPVGGVGQLAAAAQVRAILGDQLLARPESG
jgi:hypothetical protein